MFSFSILYYTVTGVLTFLVILFIFMYDHRWPSHRRKCRLLPKPQMRFLFGAALEIATMKQSDIMDYFIKLRQEHGSVVYVEIMGTPRVMLNDPEDIENVLNSKQCLTKGAEYYTMMPWLGEGLLTSPGKKWHMRRKMLTPAFHFKILENYIPIFNRNAKRLLEKLTNAAAKSELINIIPYVSFCTLDIICETAMGTCLDSQSGGAKEYVEAIRKTGDIILKRCMSFWLFKDWVFYSTPIGHEFNKTIKKLHHFTEEVIKERKRKRKIQNNRASNITVNLDSDDDFVLGKVKSRKSFLDCLLDVQKETPKHMSDKDIREEVDTFMFEGHDTTSLAISWALIMLAANQDVQDKARFEIQDIFGDSDRDATPQDLQQLQYLELVIKETLRLYPSVPFTSRYINKDLKLKNYTVPAETFVAIMPYVLHRNPDYFDDPEAFIPERFVQNTANKTHPYSYIPFSAGHRNCIGQKFAMLEEKIVLSTILRKLKVNTKLNPAEIKVVPEIILRPYTTIELWFEEIKH